MAKSRVIQFWAAQVISADGQNSQSFACGKYTTAEFYFETTAKTGTSPTLDLDIETSPDNSSWFKDSDVTQINDPTVTFRSPVHLADNIGEFIRVGLPSGAIGGTDSPALTLNAWVVLKSP